MTEHKEAASADWRAVEDWLMRPRFSVLNALFLLAGIVSGAVLR